MDTTTRRLPLRAVDPKTLAEMHARYEPYTQRKGKPQTRLADKPVDQMTLGELIRTQHDEPPSESRRAWLATGQGALTLDGASDDPDGGSLADTITDNHDAARFGVSYATVDPDRLALIRWEQEVARSGECITFGRRNGRVWVDRYVARTTWLALRDRAEELDLGPGTGRRYRLTPDALREARRRAWQNLRADEARHRALADPEWHGSYERTAKGRVIGRVLHGPKSQTPESFWHGVARDRSEVELGTDLGSDEELEATLGLAAPDRF